MPGLGDPTGTRLASELLKSPVVVGFMRRHREVESAPRRVCPECQFEQNEHYASHAPGCVVERPANTGDHQ